MKRKKLYRLIVIGRKRLPDVTKREKEWAFVYKVSSQPDEIEEDLEQTEYVTKTAGIRVRPAAQRFLPTDPPELLDYPAAVTLDRRFA